MQSHTGVLHGHVPVEPKPLLRAFRHSKAYLNT
ncbi:Zinc finger 7 -like protein [Gossypium arboreum]|uniref:Zinc finger 7-like protein n=1 Tax=Gossypium arboreum TaxID=29729 RepID=A0A0B0N2G6_GOSAR|nr:Zinc finger 7 -like protein [Gossypium arboreum]